MSNRLLLLLLPVSLFAFLSACSGGDKDKPTGVIPGYQQQALEKARNTEQVLQDAAQQQRQAMDDQGS